MRHVKVAAYVFGVVLVSISLSFGEEKLTESTKALTSDEISIYKTVLSHYTSQKTGKLNVSIRTYPLDPNSHRGLLSMGECLKGIELDNSAGNTPTFHNLPPDVLPNEKMRLVDPKKQSQIVRSNDPNNTMRKGKSIENAVASAFDTALFSLSEIVFDKERRHAVLSYSFRCGSLCGNGSTVVLEKIGNDWKITERKCGGWIS
jgi:hypothetical protein